MTTFDPSSVDRLTFSDCRWDAETGEATLGYELGERHFIERLRFPGVPDPAGVGRAALESALRLAQWLAGVSYFKAALPPSVAFSQAQPGPLGRVLLGEVYRHGLAEMTFRSGLTPPPVTLFESATAAEPGLGIAGTVSRPTGSGVVVPLGGGKDSLVTCDALHRAGIAFRTVAVGSSTLIQDMAELLETQGYSQGHLQIGRTIDPELLALNRSGAYNGHVPITAVLAGIMLVAGVLYRFDTVIMSNERSADAANLELANGEQVNHQYSKSAAFERRFQEAVEREVLQGFRYFSLLRGASEVAIARRFASLATWHQHFSSCNRNFHLDGSPVEGRWCRNCPKCRFVFLALAPHLSPDELLPIFGGDLLDDPLQEAGFRALCGLDEIKPFECVGEVEESAALMRALASDPSWRDRAVVAALADEVADAPSLEGFYEEVSVGTVPPEFQHALIDQRLAG